jgi:hypothetical protein
LTPEALGQVDTAILREFGGEGFTLSQAQKVMARRGWKSIDNAYREAGIPEKHWPVINLILPSDFSTGVREGGFSNAEIARYTGHPVRTVKLWIHDGLEKLKRLDLGDFAPAVPGV